MDRRAYTETVLSTLRRVTGDEKLAIRAELDGHIEDHMEGLLELGYVEALAEERTLAAMGDPKEVGRELNKQYTGWPFVLLSRAAVALTAVLCIQALLGVAVLGNLWDSVWARTVPLEPEEISSAAKEQLDIRIPVGSDVVRVYGVSRLTREGVPAAGVFLCAYDRLPGGVVSDYLLPNVRIEDQRGTPLEWQSDGGGYVSHGSFGADYQVRYVPVEPSDTFLTLRYDRFGEDVSVKIPLPEVTP